MPESETDSDPGAVDRAERYARLAQLLNEWQEEEEDGYDWDVIEREIMRD